MQSAVYVPVEIRRILLARLPGAACCHDGEPGWRVLRNIGELDSDEHLSTFASVWVVRHEKRNGTMVIIVSSVLIPTTFSYTTLWALTYFATINILVSTVGMTWQCYRNLRRGLRPDISGDKNARIMGETFEMELRGFISGAEHTGQAR